MISEVVKIPEFRKNLMPDAPKPPLANAWLRHESQAPPPQKKIVGPPWQSGIRPWTTTEKFIWESNLADSWLCVERYMSMHYKIFLWGKND